MVALTFCTALLCNAVLRQHSDSSRENRRWSTLASFSLRSLSSMCAALQRRMLTPNCGLIKALKGQMANYKVPKHVHFVPELPRNAMGKVMKNTLRETYARPLTLA